MFKKSTPASRQRRPASTTEALQLKRWDDASEQQCAKDSTHLFTCKPQLNHKIVLWQGDMINLSIDAIVNAANRTLRGGGGIDGAIHRAAGRNLEKECRTLNGCETGNTKVTKGYNLPAKHVLHTVGPIGEEPELLASCYRTVFEQAVENNIRSICFCCVSTGIYGYPPRAAAKVALKTVREWLESSPNASDIDLVVFCTFLKSDLEIYQNLLPQYFPRIDHSEPGAAADDEEAGSTLDASHDPAAETRHRETSEDTKQTDIDEQDTTNVVEHQEAENAAHVSTQERDTVNGDANADAESVVAAAEESEMTASESPEQKRMRSDAGETTSQDGGTGSQRVSESSHQGSAQETTTTGGEGTHENQPGGEDSGQVHQTDGEETKEA